MEVNPLWTEVDEYVSDKLLGQDATLNAALEANQKANLPAIDVAPNQGKLLQILVQMMGARKILELGTLGGYSTIWLARGLPADGHLVTLELQEENAAIAQSNIDRAGLQDQIEIRVAPALESLQKLFEEGAGPFDFIFIDADKPNNPAYFEWALKLARIGTVIVVDNVIRRGKLVDPSCTDPRVIGTRSMFDAMKESKQISATALQTVGSKGWDGFTIAIVTQPST